MFPFLTLMLVFCVQNRACLQHCSLLIAVLSSQQITGCAAKALQVLEHLVSSMLSSVCLSKAERYLQCLALLT